MAGHSKWHNIKHKKARADAAKAKIYAKVAKVITVAARKGANPDMNPYLATALQKAKYNSLPKHVIEKAIAKGAGLDGGGEMEDVFYEGYGPGGAALYIKCLTDNSNRSAASIRAILTRMGGSLGEPGSVSRQFQEKGVIVVDGYEAKTKEKGREVATIQELDKQKRENLVFSMPIDDVELQDGLYIITTSKEKFNEVVESIEEASYHIDDAGLQFLADNTITLDDKMRTKFESLLDQLDDDDDVDDVYHNVQ